VIFLCRWQPTVHVAPAENSTQHLSIVSGSIFIMIEQQISCKASFEPGCSFLSLFSFRAPVQTVAELLAQHREHEASSRHSSCCCVSIVQSLAITLLLGSCVVAVPPVCLVAISLYGPIMHIWMICQGWHMHMRASPAGSVTAHTHMCKIS